MSKIYNTENQVILRLPLEIARKVNSVIEKNEQPPEGAEKVQNPEDFLELIPYSDKDGSESQRFQYIVLMKCL